MRSRIRAVPGSRKLSLACRRVRLFRPWAEYIIAYRLVKLVRRALIDANWRLTIPLTKHDFNSAEPIILAIDTSSKATCMAVARGARILKSASQPEEEKRSDTLWSEARTLLSELGMTIRDVDIFSVCIGPGSFTGLRVGIAAAIGFSEATAKPLAGVTSLEASAFAAGPEKLICALVDAYKGEVYSQLFSFNGEGAPVPQNDPIVSTLEKALDRVSGEKELVFAGEGARVGAEVIRTAAGSGVERTWTTNKTSHSLAEAIARLAFLRYSRGEMENLERLRACYVRPAEAEIKLSLGLLGSKIRRSMKAE